MKLLSFLLVGFLSVLASAYEYQSFLHNSIPHVDLEASGQELSSLLKKRKALSIFSSHEDNFFEAKNESIDRAIALGERLLKWIDIINSVRSNEQKIRLTSPQTRRGIPVDKPSRYSPRSVETKFQEIYMNMPEAMKNVLYSDAELPIAVPLSDKEFIDHARLVDRNYQMANRWKLLIPYKWHYVRNRTRDVRGYYFLVTRNWNSDTLSQWSELNLETQIEIRNALYGICINSSGSSCRTLANSVVSATAAIDMYNRYINQAKRIYDNFFDLRSARRDVHWANVAEVAFIPFVDPLRADIRHFIKFNIEDEFKWSSWGLKIDFTIDENKKSTSPYIVFIPGTTANVERLGGNRIEMDANKSLEEYEEQWTIRHEFGHVLGFPDCYHEFFDEDEDEFVNYQLDISDLMCSRAGNFNERMYMDLKKNYMQ